MMDLTYESRQKWNKQIPFLVWVVAIFTFLSCVGGEGILGYQIAGFGWLIPLVVSLWILARNPGRVRFPILIWFPWVCLVILYLCVAETEHALQRSIMMLCPLVVGMAVSSLNISDGELASFGRLYHYMAAALIIIVLLKTGMLVTGKLPMITGLAAEVMTGTLLANLFATDYASRRPKSLAWWAAMVSIPLAAVTRTGIVVAGVSLPLTFAPLKMAKRVLILCIMASLGTGVFYSERVQQKMFFSGHGTLADMRMGNENFRTTGRSTMWDKMIPEIEEMPLLGHGANASEPFVGRLTGGLTHPHNDWLRLLFDYGYIGAGVFGLCLSLQIVHAYGMARRTAGEISILFFAGASSFLSFFLFMFTDNIILYAAFFGNLQFTMLGLAYAALRTRQENDPPYAYVRAS